MTETEKTKQKVEIDSGIEGGSYLQKIRQIPLLTQQEENDLAKKIKKGDEKALETLIVRNLRLVVRIANDYRGMGLSITDIIQEGNIGLMIAAKRFDPNKGGKLSTYAAYWIKQGIKRALSNQARTV